MPTALNISKRERLIAIFSLPWREGVRGRGPSRERKKGKRWKKVFCPQNKRKVVLVYWTSTVALFLRSVVVKLS